MSKKRPETGEFWKAPNSEAVYKVNMLRMGYAVVARCGYPGVITGAETEVSIDHMAKHWTWVEESGLPMQPTPLPIPLTPKIEVGTVVRLKSGGPLMTVTGSQHEDPPVWWCAFFTTWGSEEKSDRLAFPASCLDIVTKDIPDESVG